MEEKKRKYSLVGEGDSVIIFNKQAPKQTCKPWFVYLLKCSDQTLYCGSTNNLERRLKEHNRGSAARYTRGRGPVSVVYVEKQPTLLSARRREQQIKGLTKLEKIDLINA